MEHAETLRVKRIYDAIAARYDRGIVLSERLLFGDGRQRVCNQARGDVLEVAIGTGRNLAYYPLEVQLIGIDLSQTMVGLAQQRSDALRRAALLYVGDAQALPFPDLSFDTVVFTLALCSIPNDRKAVREARRVLRPGGRLLLLEHVRSPLWPVQLGQRALDPLARKLMADHLMRDPLDYLAADGFVIDQVERSGWGIVERVRAHRPH